ncbi:hypothetical protein MNBD_ALPHA12-2081 [hydrothermal vent metagenome]|uniref:Uncharacterized protein n=1 Tax=hydrothermal vent metagenome TaxID=652676 RepID=A0A3B0TT70_9ZZZZ
MKSLNNIIKRFSSNEDGVFAVIFAMMAVVLVAMTGAVVDFVSVQKARSETQLALDSAALALQPKIYTKTPAQLRVLANALVKERLTNSNAVVSVNSAKVVKENGTLLLEAKIKVPMAFVSLVGIKSLDANMVSQATRKQLFVEVMMVLDNSGSMSWYSRMTNLKSAAANATEILFAGAASQPNVFMGVVPFTSFVNVGSSRSNSPWLDTAGRSSIAADNFDNDNNDATPFNGPVNRLALYNQLSNVSWKGCVVARPHTVTGPGSHLDTDDITPTPTNPDTLFVPSFAPDTPDSWPSWLNDYLPDGGNSGGSSSFGSNFMGGGHGNDDDNENNNSGGNASNNSVCGNTSGLSDRERQERLCKYQGSISNYSYGPNMDCPDTAILPLTNNKQNVLNTIKAMKAGGATNIHQGAIWGFRGLSPSEPFTEGRPYDQATSKVMILMTDGANTMYSANNMNGAYYYSAYGFPYNRRIGAPGWSSAKLVTEMNVRTVEACSNAKAAGITIYTIGLNPPNSTTRKMLENCATSNETAYFPKQPSELNSVFATIANQLSALRLSQ